MTIPKTDRFTDSIVSMNKRSYLSGDYARYSTLLATFTSLCLGANFALGQFNR